MRTYKVIVALEFEPNGILIYVSKKSTVLDSLGRPTVNSPELI